MTSRREFLAGVSGLVVASSVPISVGAIARNSGMSGSEEPIDSLERVSLNGLWRFQLDPDSSGEKNCFQLPSFNHSAWQEVAVPHTWQIDQGSTDYYGTAWYHRTFDARPEWKDKVIRVEFEAVFHSAMVWVNGKPAGQHLRKGYTAFTFDISPLLQFGAQNTLVVKVNNAFDDGMLPRGRSSDWTHDGGIYRPVSLLVTPNVYIERVDVEAVPDLERKLADLEIVAVVSNKSRKTWKGQISYRAIDENTGNTVLEKTIVSPIGVKPGETVAIEVPKDSIRDPKLWHFDAPNLHTLTVGISDTAGSIHQFTSVFGIRSIEVRNGAFYLNGEKVRLMGVERMAGSNPQFGMAEPASWIDHDHRDMKELNCVFTRVHWPQDKRVLDFCDRHGILIQTEVPTWGPKTFQDMHDQPSPEIMENGLEQLREMIARDRNHPSIFSWGLCNEIGGQNPPAYNFAKRMYAEAKKLNPRRLCSYASNSLQSTPGKDVSSLMDFVEWNEYYETWYPGTPETVRQNLKEITAAFPGKPIVISEYGYCACTADRPEGDQRRIEILRSHDQVFRESQAVGGLIFFCYNDYRTHVGDKGSGVMKQRVHGVVDLFGTRKSSYEDLRKESSPVEEVQISGQPAAFVAHVRTRSAVPGYVLRGYKLRAVLYGPGEIPLELREVQLPVIGPGETVPVEFKFEANAAMRVVFDVLRPTGFSAYSHVWKP